MEKNLTALQMKGALTRLDELLPSDVTLIIGGGGAMLLAHGFPLATTDIDGIPKGIEIGALDVWVKQIAQEKGLPPDWLNPYFSTFAHTLPPDYGNRLITVYSGRRLRALALGKEDLLVMKCFAHRQKDVGHARALIRLGPDLKMVENHIEALQKKGIPGADKALEFLDELLDMEGV